MANWTYNPNEFTARNFETIPEGDYKVIINKVEEKIFNTGNEGFEITFTINGFNSKLWYYLVLDPKDSTRTNQRLGMFFDSFEIRDYDLSHYYEWVGKDGAVRVKHDMYNGNRSAKVAFCLSRSQQSRIPMRGNVFGTEGTKSSNSSPASRERAFDGFSF